MAKSYKEIMNEITTFIFDVDGVLTDSSVFVTNDGVRVRLRNLGITDIHLGTPNKVETFDEYTDVYGIKPEQVLYMGDDIPDYHVMKLVGLPACPQDASPEIKAISNYISHKKGGKGAARDVIEQVMKVQGKWMAHFDGKHD